MGAHPRDRAGSLHPRGGITPKHTAMDGQLSPRKVIASSRYGSSLKNIYAEGVDRFGEIQARKYLERILTAVEELEFFYPYHPECRHLATKNRMYRNIILDAHLIIYRIGKERIEVLDIVHAASCLRRIRDIRKIKI